MDMMTRLTRMIKMNTVIWVKRVTSMTWVTKMTKVVILSPSPIILVIRGHP